MGMRPAGPGSCPKRMVMGPCGGVRADGSCEVAPRPCVFETPVEWTGPAAAPAPLRTVPRILTDFSSEPWSAAMLASVAAVLGPGCDAVLVGEHQDRPDFPPTLHASLLMAAGVRPWMTLTCRDRNRIVLEQDLTGLRELGVDAGAGGLGAILGLLGGGHGSADHGGVDVADVRDDAVEPAGQAAHVFAPAPLHADDGHVQPFVGVPLGLLLCGLGGLSQ